MHLQSSKKNEQYGVMDAVAANLLGKLLGAGRHGRYAEVLELWLEKRKSWNHLVEISAYADQGALMNFFPVSKRFPDTQDQCRTTKRSCIGPLRISSWRCGEMAGMPRVELSDPQLGFLGGW